MATFTITVKTIPEKAERPRLDLTSLVDDACETLTTVIVPVPAGQSRHITIDYVNAGTASSTATISTETNYLLQLYGAISETPSLNTEFSSAVIHVRLTVTEDIFYSHQIVRTHTGNPC